MTICITPNSISVFAGLVNQKINLSPELKGPDLLKEIFNFSLEQLKDNGLSTQRNEEIVLQHLSIVPQLVKSKLADNPAITNKELEKYFDDLSTKVLNAINDEKDFEKVLNELNQQLFGTKRVFAPNSFSAVADRLFKTNNNEAVYNENGYSDNIQDPKRQFEFSVIRNLLEKENINQLQIFLKKDLPKLTDGSEYLNLDGIGENDLVMVLINSDKEIIKFDEQINPVAEKGSVPVFTILTDSDFAVKRDVWSNTLTKAEVEKKVKEFENNISLIKSTLTEGKPVLVNINRANSSVGVTATDSNKQTMLTDLTNLDNVKINFEESKGLRNFTITPENAQVSKRVFGEALSNLSDNEIEILHYLITTKAADLKIKHEGADNDKIFKSKLNSYKSKLIRYFISEGEKQNIHILEDQGIVRFKISEGVYEEKPINEITLDYLKEKINNKYFRPAQDASEFDKSNASTNKESVKVGQLYKDPSGKVWRAEGYRRHHGINKQTAVTNSTDVTDKTPLKVEDGILIVNTVPVKVIDHVKKHFYTTLVPNAEGKLMAIGAYLAFEPFIAPAKAKNIVKFKSVGAKNITQIKNPIQEKDALDWWANSPLAQVVGVEFLNRLSEYGPNYLAAFVNGSIELYQGSSNTELYHEAFHAYFDGILSQSERNNIYSSLRKNPGYFTVVVNGQKKRVAYSLATEIELEEYLAESFREFALSKGKKTKFSDNKIVAFFQKLYDILKNVFGNMSYAEARALNKSNSMVDSLFKDLYRGNFSAKDFSLLNSEAKHKSSELKLEGTDEFTLEDVSLTMTSMQAMMGDFIRYGLNSSRNQATMQELTGFLLDSVDQSLSKEERETAAAYLKSNLQIESPSGNGVFLLNSNTFVLNALTDYIKKGFEKRLAEVNDSIKENNLEQDEYKKVTTEFVLNKQKTLLEKILKEENFGKISDVETYKENKQLSNEAVPNSLISLFFTNYSNIYLDNDFSEIPEERTAEDEKFVPLWDVTGNEQAFDETIDKGTIAILENIVAYSNQGFGEMLFNPLGFPKILPVKNVIAKIAKKLANIKFADDMSAKLKELAKTDKEIEQVFRMLGDISDSNSSFNLTRQEQKQWTNFEQSFNKATVLLREFILEQNTKVKDGEEVSTISYTIGKPASVSDTIMREWSVKFYNEVLNGPYSDELTGDKTKTNSVPTKFLDLQLFIEDARWDSLEKLFNPKNKQVRIQFLNALGINVVLDDELDNVLLNGSDFFGYDSAAIKYLYNSIKLRLDESDKPGKQSLAKITNLDELFKGFKYVDEFGQSQEQPSLKGFEKKWADLHLFYSDYYTNFASFNASGDLQSEKTYNSSLLNAAYVFNKVKTLRELIETPGFEHYDPRINATVLGSAWFVEMFNLGNGELKLDSPKNSKVKITVENLSGSKLIRSKDAYQNEEGEFVPAQSKETGFNSISLNEVDKFITDLYLTLKNTQEILRSEAKSTSLTVFTKMTDNDLLKKGFLNNIFSENYLKNIKSNKKELFEIFKHSLASELVRISSVKKLKSAILNGEITNDDLAIDVKHLNRGEDFFIFDAILSTNTKNELKAANIENAYKNVNGVNVFSINQISNELKEKVEKELVAYFKQRAESLEQEMLPNVILSGSLLEAYSNETIEDEEERKNNATSTIFKAHVLNNFFNNLNYSNLFLGDPANIDVEKGDFHKRIAGYISSGKIFRNDKVWQNFVNTPLYNAFGFANKHTNNKTIRTYSGKLNTAVLSEAASNSIYARHYSEVLGIDSSKYDGGDKKAMEEADGQGYISFDAYRLLQDSIGEWSDKQEAVYQKMLSGEKFDISEIQTTFPIRKYQYYGDVSNARSKEILESLGININNVAFHKYSLFPLVPALIENTPLQKLHEKMMEQDIDYVTMTTGSKLSTLSKVEVLKDEKGNDVFKPVYDDFYSTDKRGEVNDNPDFKFTKNTIDVTYLKSQNYIAEGYHGYVTFPTQIKKIILVGILDKGVPVDFKYTGKKPIKEAWDALSANDKLKASDKWKWYRDYVDTINELETKLKNDLLEDIEFKEVKTKDGITYVGDSTKLANYLKSQLKSKELLPEEISYLIEADGTLKNDLSLSLISEKVEEILVTLVDKKLRNIKVNGEALVQVAGTMFEPLKKSDEQKSAELKYGTNGLKFYFLQDENGNEVLTKDGKAVVKGMDVKISLQGDFKKLLFTKDENGEPVAVYDVIDNKRILNYEKSLANLNKAIKTKGWLNKYGKLIELPGVRIPTQGPNSLISATVAEFLPEFAGPMVILPTEIVSQSGADFDIDKLFMMFKNIANYRGSVEEIVYDKSVTESYEDLNLQLSVLEKDLEPLNKDIVSLWTEYKKWMEEKSGVNSELERDYEDVKNLKKEIDDLYNQKQEVFKNKDLSVSKKKKLHATLDSKIETLKNYRNEQFAFINKQLTSFYNSEVKDKISKDKLQQQKHEEYLNKIAAAEERYSNKENQVISIQKKINGKTSKGLENRIFNLFNERILMSDNINNLVTPNTTDSVEPLAKEASTKIKTAFNKLTSYRNESTSAPGKITKTSIFDYRFNLGVHQENSVGKDSLGVAAVTATFYALFTTFGATIQGTTPEQQARFIKALEDLENNKPGSYQYKQAINVLSKFENRKLKFVKGNAPAYNLNEQTDSIMLGAIDNIENQSIADLISQLINGFVDVAKDPWVFNLQASKQNAPIILFMIMSGVSIPNIVNLFNNPLVLEYNKELSYNSGLFARLNEEFSFDESEKEVSAVNKLQERYVEAYKPFVQKGIVTFNSNSIANSAKDFTEEDLKERLGKEINERDFEILAHFLQIKKLSNAITEFTFLTKYDTEKIASTSDALARIEATKEFKRIKVEDKIIPNLWFDEINNSPLGKFNNDEFIIALFNRYFKLRNNPNLVKLSLKLQNISGVRRSKMLSDFKNDFLLFLYQNAVYNSNVYTTSSTEFLNNGKISVPGKQFSLVEDASVDGVVIDTENNKVLYNSNSFNAEAGFGEFVHVKKFFLNQPVREYAKFRVEYNNLMEAHKNMSDEELIKKYETFNAAKLFDRNASNYRTVLFAKVALFNTSNPIAMFDKDYGLGPIVSKMTSLHQLNSYSVFSDIKKDFSKAVNKTNLFFPLIKDANLASVYKENLEELKNHPDFIVRDFAQKFTHFAIMQAGLNKGAKFSLTALAEQDLFSKVIESEIGLDRILQNLNEGDSSMLDQFFKLYNSKSNRTNYFYKTRGRSYLVDKIDAKAITKQNLVGVNKITILPFNMEPEQGQDLLTAEILMSNPNPVEYAKSLINVPFVIKNEKMVSANQKVLDKALLVLGIDNKGNLPVLKLISGKSTTGSLSIASSEVQKLPHAIKDQAMAQSATKAIGKETEPLNDGYSSSSRAYAKAIENDNNNPDALAKGKNFSFEADDKVWVFGSTIAVNAYKGSTEQEFIQKVEKTFNSYHKVFIDKAIADGVSNFYVGNASGIDQMTKDYLESKGFRQIVRFSNYGAYNEYVSEQAFAKAQDELYNTKSPVVNLRNAVFNEKLNSPNGQLLLTAISQKNLYDFLKTIDNKKFLEFDSSDAQGLSVGERLFYNKLLEILKEIYSNESLVKTIGTKNNLSAWLKANDGLLLIGNEIGTSNYNHLLSKSFMLIRKATVNKQQVATQPAVSTGVKVISEDYGVVQAETNPTKEFDQKIANVIFEDVRDNAYVENGSNTAQRMWGNGLMWKGNNTKKPTGTPLKVIPAQVDNAANGKLKTVNTPYFYDPLYNDGTPVAPIENLNFLKKHIENTLGIDMSDYDVSLNNIYEEGHNLYRHTDIDESNTAKGYPVIVYVFGNDHKVRFDDNGGKRLFGQMVNPKTLTLKNGGIYAFGMGGRGRFETVHDVVASPKTNDNFPELIGADGAPTKKYTVTFTFRRAADLKPGMPITPAQLSTQPTGVKPTIDTSREWKGDLESRLVYTSEGVNTMRTTFAVSTEHFGNPFSEAGYGNTFKVNSISDAVLLYKAWLSNDNATTKDFGLNPKEFIKAIIKSAGGKPTSKGMFAIDGQYYYIPNLQILSKPYGYDAFINVGNDELYLGSSNKGYTDFVSNSEYNLSDLNYEQHEWILDQINQGKLDGATLLYAGKSEARGQGMHPTALAEVVEELRGNQSSSQVNYQKSSVEGIVASEKTIRDLAARMAARIGMSVVFPTDRSKEYKGKIENGIAHINLAYATLDTPIHEILGHPIIRAIKNRNKENYTAPVYNPSMEMWVVELLKFDDIDVEFFNTKEEADAFYKSKQSPLYLNLLKELEYGRGKEVLDRIKKDYHKKFERGVSFTLEGKNYIADQSSPTGYRDKYGDDVDSNELETALFAYELKHKDQIFYTLEEQQEEAIVELLGMMTAEKLDAVKDGKLISLLKKLLKEMKAFMRELLNLKEIEVDKLPDNMTIGDIADLLAYSNSNIILPGNEVVYTTPDNMSFKTYQEASNHISELAKSVKDIDLSTAKIDKFSNIPDKFESPGGIAFKKDGRYYLKELTPEFNEEGDFINESETIIEISKEQFINQYKDSPNFHILDKNIDTFISKNKEYEISKEIIDEWKKVNNIQYNPEEIYSRGQEFVSVVGAYSKFDVKLMMQNLLSHIEDNEKAGGKFAISAFTKPINKRIGHLERGGGKIKFKIYPQSKDILWATNRDAHSGSVWDASEKVNKDKRSELLGVSYTKYPSLTNINAVQSNLASIVENLNDHHNELGITLTGNNFRLEYDENIPYQTKKIIDGINSILDQKYGKLVKPKISNLNAHIYYSLKEFKKIEKYLNAKAVVEELEDNTWIGPDNYLIKYVFEDGTVDVLSGPISKKESLDWLENNKINQAIALKKEIDGFDLNSMSIIEPTKTKETLKESIESIKDDIIGFSKKDQTQLDYLIRLDERNEITTDQEIELKELKNKKKNITQKEYTSQALINTKIAALKEVAKKYPRRLIRSEVKKQVLSYNDALYEQFGTDDLSWQKLPSKKTVISFSELNFTASEKQTILTNFTAKYLSGKTTQEAQKYIDEALAKSDEQGQKEIIEKLKECYR